MINLGTPLSVLFAISALITVFSFVLAILAPEQAYSMLSFMPVRSFVFISSWAILSIAFALLWQIYAIRDVRSFIIRAFNMVFAITVLTISGPVIDLPKMVITEKEIILDPSNRPLLDIGSPSWFTVTIFCAACVAVLFLVAGYIYVDRDERSRQPN